MNQIKNCISVLLIIFPGSAFAYLDPGSGSILLYFFIGLLASIIYAIKDYFYKIKTFLIGGRVDYSLKKIKDTDILFYSEGGQYWHVFEPVISALNKRNINCAYYTSSSNDPALKSNYENLCVKFIGNEVSSITLLNNMSIDIIIMTTPQLDVLQLKRSKRVKHYVHLMHSPIDALFYNKFAFDYFDAVMCSGIHQIESIRALENKRKTHKKLLLKTGLTYYDVMEKNKEPVFTEFTTVLIAPSWTNKSVIANNFSKLTEVIEILLKNEYAVIFRPHPQMLSVKKQEMLALEQKLSIYTKLEIDKNPSGVNSMNKADVMISDLSGVAFDFFFVYEKPIVIVDVVIKTDGFEAEDVSKVPWEIDILPKISTKVNLNNVVKIPSILETAKVFTRQVFNRMKPSAFFINIGRGETVDEESLVLALESEKIAGAGLDVFSQEPLAKDSPLWSMESVILSPHVAGLSKGYWDRQADLFMQNLKHYLECDNELMHNIVDMIPRSA